MYNISIVNTCINNIYKRLEGTKCKSYVHDSIVDLFPKCTYIKTPKRFNVYQALPSDTFQNWTVILIYTGIQIIAHVYTISQKKGKFDWFI